MNIEDCSECGHYIPVPLPLFPSLADLCRIVLAHHTSHLGYLHKKSRYLRSMGHDYLPRRSTMFMYFLEKSESRKSLLTPLPFMVSIACIKEKL